LPRGPGIPCKPYTGFFSTSKDGKVKIHKLARGIAIRSVCGVKGRSETHFKIDCVTLMQKEKEGILCLECWGEIIERLRRVL